MIDGIPAWDETWPAEERWTEERPWEKLFPDQFAVELPTVFHSVWRSPDGRVAAVFVNWSREPRAFRLETPDLTAAGELPARTWKLIERKEDR